MSANSQEDLDEDNVVTQTSLRNILKNSFASENNNSVSSVDISGQFNGYAIQDQDELNDEIIPLTSNSNSKKISPPEKKGKAYWFGYDLLFEEYDKSFLILLGLQYVDQGFRSLISLGIAKLFKDFYKLEPSESQYWNSFIVFPWSIKIVYGIISDNLAICGSRKKSYIIIGGLIQLISLQMYFWIQPESIFFTSFLFMTVNFSSAFMDVVVDSMMVIQSKKDPVNGSEKLQGYSWTVRGIGGISGSIISAYMTEYYHPKWCILIYSCIGFFIAYSGIMLNPEIDKEGLDDMQGFMKDLKRSAGDIYKIRKIPQIYQVLLYIVLRGCVVPSFGDFWYYYVTNVKGFSQLVVGLMGVLGNISLMIGAFLYSKYFFQWEFRYILTISNLIVFFGGVLGAVFVLNIHQWIGLNDIFFYGIQAFFEDALLMAFIDLPCMVLFAKIIPKNIEGTVFAFLTGTINFSNGVLSPMIGSIINDSFVGVTTDNMKASNFIKLVWIETFLALVPIAFLTLIPLKASVNELQKKFELEAKNLNDKVESVVMKPRKGSMDSEIDLDRDL